jgi:hypothetical protein
MSIASTVKGYNAAGESLANATGIDLETIRKAGEDVAVYTAEFLASASVIHAAPWGTPGGNGSELDPVGPTINDAIALINSRPAGNFVLDLAPGTYAFPPLASTAFTAARATLVHGYGATIDVTGDGNFRNELVKGLIGVTITGTRRNSVGFLSNTNFLTEFMTSVIPNGIFKDLKLTACNGQATSIGSAREDVFIDNIAGSANTSSVSISGGIISNINGQFSSLLTTINGRKLIANCKLSGSLRIFSDMIKSVDWDGGDQNLDDFNFGVLRDCKLITSGMIQIGTRSGFNSLTIQNCIIQSGSPSNGAGGPILRISGVNLQKVTVQGSDINYTGLWAETGNGGQVSPVLRLNNSAQVFFDNCTFRTPGIAIYDGNWQNVNDPGQPTQDRYMSITNCDFHTTFADTANPPENPVTPLYLMSRSDTGKPTYDIHGCRFFYDGSATQRLNRGAFAIAEIRGAGSGGNNGSPNPVTGNTWARLSNNTVYAKFPAGNVTNGGKAVINVRSTPIFSEQATMLDPIVDIDGLVYHTDGNEDHTIRGADLTNVRVGLTTGTKTLTSDNPLAARRLSTSGPLVNTWNILPTVASSPLAADIPASHAALFVIGEKLYAAYNDAGTVHYHQLNGNLASGSTTPPT